MCLYKLLISLQKSNGFQTMGQDITALLMVSYLKHGPQTNNISSTWEFVRIMEFQATFESKPEFQ